MPKLKARDPLKLDPTRTQDIRRRWKADLGRRFNELRKAIRQLIVVDDAFGLAQPTVNVFCPTGEGGGVDPSCSPYTSTKPTIQPPEISDGGGGHQAKHGYKAWVVGPKAAEKFGHPEEVPVSSLVATQDYINPDRVNELLKESSAEKPILIRQGSKVYVGDGHHRVESAKHGGATHIKGQVIDLDEEGRPTSRPVANAGQFKFHRDVEKLVAFKLWLARHVSKMNPAPLGGGDPWVHTYLQEAAQRGKSKAFDAVRKPALAKKLDFYQGRKKEFLTSSFSKPASINKIQFLAARTYEDLKGVTDTMSTQIARTLANGMLKGQSPREVARDMEERVDVSESRALTISRTETIAAHAEGSLDAFEELGVEELGVEAEWSTSGLPSVCPLCQDEEGKTYTVAEARGKIPLHPNAVFAGSGFSPYGECKELVRAWYCGPSIVLTLRSGEYRTAIGPNHPVMTRRGMIKAAELDESDYVLYDTRGDVSTAGLYIEQVPLIEDIFEALLGVPNHARVVSSSSDLHGDGVFCQGEIKAVRPANGLLRVWDSCGVEILRDNDFTRTDPQLESGSGLSASNLGSHGILLTSPSSVRSRSILATRKGLKNPHANQPSLDRLAVNSERFGEGSLGLSGQVSLPNFFKWERIHSVSPGHYEGFAFDATTATSLYYIGGIVVSNCMCSWIPGGDALTANRRRKLIRNVFCPTGEGGGVDPSCSPKMPSAKEMLEQFSNTNVPEELIPTHVYLGMPSEFASDATSKGLTPGIKGRLADVGGNRKDSLYVAVKEERASGYAHSYREGTVIKIDTSKLDRSKFFYDPLDVGDHDIVNDPQQMAYRGAIPPAAISRVKEES